MNNELSSFSGKRVLITGHTGFKGSWLSLWLSKLGADVYGMALAPSTAPAMFDLCDVEDVIHHAIVDIRNFGEVRARIAEVRPEIVFHMAAQPIVRQSYVEPLETMATNVMGTANVLEAIRAGGFECSVVVVSSDKCYENRDWIWGYREMDPMGGSDPYSASKGATELVTSCWRDSYFSRGSGVRLASGRAGNVIGGGDWASDRIVPDCIEAFRTARPVQLRNPQSTRPWQHVLEPLSGYLLVASRLMADNGDEYCEGWNFGPGIHDVRPVKDLVEILARGWGGDPNWGEVPGPHVKEAAMLALNCDKAHSLLGWRPTWTLEEAARHTIEWYVAWANGETDLKALSLGQIAEFESDAPGPSNVHRAL